MAGIYIHIPYCQKKCTYCNFYFSTQTGSINDFIDSLIIEISLKKNYLVNSEINTIYFGGGTPSILTAIQLKKIIEALYVNYLINTNKLELTIEANPEDISNEILQSWLDIGINRISLGIQSLDDEVLNWMNRSVTKTKCWQSLDLVANYFKNYSIDIIYGLPFVKKNYIKNLLHSIRPFQPKHISTYCLTVEEKTLLHNQIKNKEIEPLPENKQIAQYWKICHTLREWGYNHYEISNFSLTGFESTHNSNYWNFEAYLGFGPAAHSFISPNRFWNLASIHLYIKNIKHGKPFTEFEIINPSQKYNELIMFAFRRSKGASFKDFINLMDKKELEKLKLQLQNLPKNLINIDSEGFRLTEEGWLWSNKLAIEFFK